MMERALKERIIGAIVIVALVVLVVPVFLDGPPDSGEILSERVPLPGQSDQQTQTVVLDRDRSEPVPAQASATSGTAAQQKERTVDTATIAEEKIAEKTVPGTAAAPVKSESSKPKAAPIKAASESPAPTSKTTSATGMWAVQLGSFSNQENAERLAADLRKQGFAAFLSQMSTPSGQLHRVRIGPQKDREAAEAMATRLQKAGHKGKVLPHP